MKQRFSPDYDRLLAFIEVFDTPEFSSGQWEFCRGCLPEFTYAPETNAFVQTLYDDGWTIVFDWGRWQGEAVELLNEPEKLNAASMETLRKLLTLHVRKDRFCEGHLASVLKSGHILAILKRIRDIREETRE